MGYVCESGRDTIDLPPCPAASRRSARGRSGEGDEMTKVKFECVTEESWASYAIWMNGKRLDWNGGPEDLFNAYEDLRQMAKGISPEIDTQIAVIEQRMKEAIEW